MLRRSLPFFIAVMFGASGPALAVTETLRIGLPAASVLSGHRTPELEGVPGHTQLGCYVAWDTVYVHATWDDGTEQVGVDPGPSVAALAGRTRIQVDYGAGNLDATAVAILWAAAIQAAIDAGDWDGAVTRDGSSIEVSGAFTAADAFTGGAWDDRDPNAILGTLELTATSSFGVDSTRGHVVDSARILAVTSGRPFRVPAMRVLNGNNVSGDIRLGLATGGTGGATPDPDGATVHAQKVTGTRVADDWSPVFFAPGDVQYFADPATMDPLWAMIQGSGAGSSISAENGGGLDGDYVRDGSNQVLHITAQATGSGTAMPTTLTSSRSGGGSTNNFAIAIQILIQVANADGEYYGDGEWVSVAGATPGRNDTLGASSNMNRISVGWGMRFPVVEDGRVSAAVNFAVHGATQQFRVELWNYLGTAQDVTGDTIAADFGPTTGSSTGWYTYPTEFAFVGGLYRVTLKSEGSAPPGVSQLNFLSGEPNFDTILRYGYGAGTLGATGETEVEYTADDGETNTVYNSAIATPSPRAPTVPPVPSPGNSPGLSLRLRSPGFVLTANP